jgi:hypothetical protein
MSIKVSGHNWCIKLKGGIDVNCFDNHDKISNKFEKKV